MFFFNAEYWLMQIGGFVVPVQALAVRLPEQDLRFASYMKGDCKMMNCTINIEEKGRDKSVRRNIPLDFLYRFLSCFDIAGTIWVLYMVYRGLPLWQIGLIEGVFHVASFLFEVPSGALADLLGRKCVIVAGRICAAVSSLMMLGGRNIVHFMIAFVISAFGYNLNSGSEEALVYDSLKEEGREHAYQQTEGRLEVVMEIASAVGVFTGGVLAEHSFRWCYIAAFAVAVLSLLPSLFFREPGRDGERAADAQYDKTSDMWPDREERKEADVQSDIDERKIPDMLPGKKEQKAAEVQHDIVDGKISDMLSGKEIQRAANAQPEHNNKNRGWAVTLRTHARTCAGILRGNRAVRRVLLYYPALAAFEMVMFYYGQEFFSQMGLNKIGISVLLLINGAVSSVGAAGSAALTRKLGNRMRTAASLFVVLGYFLVVTCVLPVSAVGFWLVSLGGALLNPLQSAQLNALIPSAQRATIISMDSMMFSVFMIALFPLAGLLADAVGLQYAFLVDGILAAVIIFAAARMSFEQV